MNFNTSSYLIHNNDKERKVFRENIKNLMKSLNINLSLISKQEISYKGFSNIKLKINLIKNIFNFLVFNIYHKRNFLFQKKNNLLINLIFPLLLKVIRIISNNKEKNFKIYQHNVIENVVREKHILAWESFLKTNNKYLIVFEDDAICKHNSRERLKLILKKLSLDKSNHFYIDLAGGYNPKKILPFDHKLKDKFFDILICKLYTNTACSYLVNRAVIKEFLRILKEDNFSKNFPIDHLINYLGFRSKFTIYCGHFIKPIFTHGSFKDKIKSWQC